MHKLFSSLKPETHWRQTPVDDADKQLSGRITHVPKLVK